MVLLASAGYARAQEAFQLRDVERLHLDDVEAGVSGERRVRLYLRAETAHGDPIEQLRPSDLAVRDEGEVIEPGQLDIRMLGDAGRGASVVLALDTSRTMRGEPFEQARAAALAVVERLGSFDRVAVLSFDDEVRVIAGFDTARAQTKVSHEQLEIEPRTLSTVLWDAVHAAVELVRRGGPELPRRSFVLLFSDGKDSGSVHSLDEVIAYARGEDGQPRTPVFTVGFSRFGGVGLENLDELARGTAASAFRATAPSELGGFFAEIWRKIMQSWVVEYSGRMDGRRHTVEVSIGEQSDSRAADYPEVRAPLWPWLLSALVLAVAGVAVVLVLRGRSGGRLVFDSGPRRGQSCPVKAPTTRIGALDENDVVINSPAVSRYHAQIHVQSGKVSVEDLGSKNGTFLNGSPVRGLSVLKPGDRLRLGDVDLVYDR